MNDETSLVQMQQAIKRHSGEANLTSRGACSVPVTYKSCDACSPTDKNVWCPSAGCVAGGTIQARSCCMEDSLISKKDACKGAPPLVGEEKDPDWKSTSSNKMNDKDTADVARALQHCFQKRGLGDGPNEFDVVMQSGTATFFYGCSPDRFNDIDLWSEHIAKLFENKVGLEEAYHRQANVVWDYSHCKDTKNGLGPGYTDKCGPEFELKDAKKDAKNLQIYCPEQTQGGKRFKEVDVWPGINEKFDKAPFLIADSTGAKKGLATVSMGEAHTAFTVSFYNSKNKVNVKVVTECHLVELKTALSLKGGRKMDALKSTDYSDLDCMCATYHAKCKSACTEYCTLCQDGGKGDDRKMCKNALNKAADFCKKATQ